MGHGPTSARDAPPEENPSSGDGGSALLTAPVIIHDTIISRASSPLPSSAGKHAAGAGPDALSIVASPPPPPGQRQRQKEEEENNRRYRPRTFSYISLLPFEAEPESERDRALHSILAELYIAVRAEDYSPGVLFWSRQLQNWLALKFEMPRPLRAKLTQMYYHLALAPGLDPTVSERLISMVVVLTRKYHYLKPLEDLTLDWRPLWKEFRILVLPAEAAAHQSGRRKSHKQLWKLCLHSQTYFDPADRREMLDEFLQYFSASDLSNGYVVVGLINALLPTDAAAAEAPLSRPAEFLPTLFHLWQLVARSRAFDHFFIDILCRLARDHLKCGHIEFAEHGIFTKEQSDHVFTAILRLTDIPVGQANSPYSSIDMSSGLGIYLEKDKKKHPIAHMIARWVVNSLSPLCLDRPDSMLANLEGLIQSVDTFFHPSNQGAWTTTLAQLVHYLVDMFVLRWNRERGGELDVPPERRITDQLRARFVLCLRGVTFMGIFSKGARVVQYYNASLQGLAYLEPGLMLPGALQRFYPSLQGLVEVHRTASSLSGLQTLAGIMARQKGYRCHLTALLALALPGIDANDLTKTQYTLGFIQTVAYSIPIAPLGGATVAAAAAVAEAGEDGALPEEVEEEDDELEGTRGGGGGGGTAAAVEWVQAEMERLEREGPDVRLDYDAELSDEAEVAILRSSTAGFGEFLRALLGRVFTLLENLPDSSHLRGGGGGGPSPEENVINALPSALAPVFASLSPDLFEIALDQIASFVNSHVVHQGREAMAWTVNALCRADPAKTLRVFVPMLIANIRNEIDHNGAASGRSSGSDYLPRDRALVWHLIMLGMVVVNAGAEMLAYRDELFGVARYLQDRCRGLPTVHIANLVHHMLLTLTRTYPMDSALGEPTEEGGDASPAASFGAPVRDWGRSTPPSELTVRWHRPTSDEIAFAEELFAWQTESAIERLNQLMSDEPPAARGGRNKEWSDEVVRALGQIRLVVSGMATLFDPARASRGDAGDGDGNGEGNGNEQAGDGGNDRDTNHEDDKMEVDQIAGDKIRGDSHDENGGDTQENEDGADQEGQPEGDILLAEGADDEVNMRNTYRCRDGYLLSPDDPVYDRIHSLRDEIGRLLSRTHAWLGARHEDDVACYTALYAAYRTWITDVGMERSAHPLERYTRLYRSEVGSFRVSGLRKRYPRPLLVKRAEAYRLQRIKHNAAARPKGPLDRRLLSDLAESCLSQYADVRRAAQGAQDSSLKAILGGRPVVIPVVMARFRRAIQEEDHDRIKGGMYTLLFTSLVKTVVRDWRFAPEMARLYIETAGIDKQSIQALGNSALLTVADLGKATDRIVLTSREPIEAIISGEDQIPERERERDRREAAIRTRRALLTKRRSRVERLKAQLGLELTRRARGAHWNVASRCALMANALCLRFQTIAPAEFVELLTLGANDAHPGLRSTHAIALTSVLAAVDVRAAYGHDYENFLSGVEVQDQRYRVPVERADDRTAYTDKFLDAFDREPTTDDDAEPHDLTACFVDSHHPGWLVWGSGFTVSPARPHHPAMAYDDTELAVRTQIGALITRDWLSRCFDFLKQEPRDSNNDRFRITNMYLLMHIFDLAHHGLTAASWDDIRDLTTAVYGDGSDKHQHRAAAEILASLLAGSGDLPVDLRDRAWAYAAPLMLDIISDDLTSENLGYWLSCLHVVTDSRDPRRYRELGGPLAAFRLDRGSDAAFKDSARVTLIEGIVADAGWHFRPHGPILEDLLCHLDHPYKSVREAVGRCIAAIHRTRHHESATDVAALLSRDAAASSLGAPPYPATPELASSVKTAFDRLERWRAEREPGQQTPSPYTMGSKTVLSWLDAALCSHECSGLVPFFATPLLTQLLHMMDVKEDPELMRLAYHVYRHIPNVPMRVGEDAAVISTLVDIGRSAPSWHQRMRALINLQVLYFRRLFLTAPAQRDAMLEAVSDMLADPQLEVRTYAGSTLAGMIRCSPRRIRDPVIIRLKDRFERELRMNPMPARSRGPSSAAGDHPDEAQIQGRVVRRHAAVLGLGGLIEAFPYATPPPSWMPEVLATLASRAAADPGVVGKATKSILSEFKKTRQDSWAVDQKYFTPEQLEDLEGVLWKSYFA